jgi:hypothetical protein
MNKTLIALAAAAFALALTPAAQAGVTVPSIGAKSLVQKTGCDGEDYAEYLEERAEARAEAIEDGEGYPSRQASVRQSRAEPQRAAAEPEQPATSSPKSTADASDKKDTKTDTKTEIKKADEPKKPDAKSVASADGSGCKKYFSSVGMTLSVPCE